jgi:hypothetical protein
MSTIKYMLPITLTQYKRRAADLFNPNKAMNIKRLWYIWLVLAIIMFFLQVITIDILPSLMQDEAQITDYGRLALDPFSRWSVTWWVAGEKPLFLWSYLGPVFAEFGYQIGGASGVGPRIIGLLGGLAASSMALGWLLERKTPPAIAGLLALGFLLDPLFTLSQRMARSDSWVMAFCLASCWLLCYSSSKRGAFKVTLVVLSGVFAAVSAFVWPSAVFLYPLISLELFRSIYLPNASKSLLKDGLKYSFYFLLGGFLISIVLILPIIAQLSMIMGDIKNMVAWNINATKTPIERLLTLVGYQPWFKLIKAFAKTLSPGLPLLALWTFSFRRERGILLASVFALAIIFMTLVYEFRILYLIPYFLALTGDFFRHLQMRPIKSIVHRISLVLLISVVIWSISISIFLRSALAYDDRILHSRSLVSDAATSAIGHGNYKVFLAFTYELYFTGRSLGWQVYTPYIQHDSEMNWIQEMDFQPKDKFLKLISTMDYAIFPTGRMNDELSKQLQLAGLNYRGIIHVSDNYTNNKSTVTSEKMIHILWFLRGANSYGPYFLYARAKRKVPPVQVTYRSGGAK